MMLWLDCLRGVLLDRSSPAIRKPNLKHMKTAGSIYVNAYGY